MSPESQPPSDDTLPLEVWKRIDALCVRFEAAWKAGKRPDLGDYLAATEGAERSALLRELLKVELHYRRLKGESPTAEEYQTLLPEDAATIRAAFDGVRSTPAHELPTTPLAETSPVIGQPTDGRAEWPVVPGYKILDQLGVGGMGVVYLAEQTGLKRAVALKMILNADLASPEERLRFQREAEALARLRHENIVQVYDIGETRGKPFFAMEFVEGGSLDQHLQGVPRPPTEAARMVETLARAMEVAHQAGIVHRDLKPANVLVAVGGVLRITDFGLAKRADDSGKTRSGAILGTPSYMAPEQARGENREVRATADVYALGAILYELLTGQPPFRGATPEATLSQVLQVEPQPPRRLKKEVPCGLETICLQCLKKSPKKRYVSALELADDLRNFLEDRPIKARPTRVHEKAWRLVRSRPLRSSALALLAIATTAALVALHYFDPERERKEAKSRLAKGETYVFEGRGHLPGPFRRVLGDAAPLTPNDEEECFSVEKVSTVLWELVDDPKCERYRFSVEVRHDDSVGRSQVGLYFGYREGQSVEGFRQGKFYTLAFADRGELVSKTPNAPPVSYVRLEPRLFQVRPNGLHAPFGLVSQKPFLPALPVGRPGPWRKLYVEVTPEGVEASWEMVPGVVERISHVPTERLKQRLEVLQKSLGELADIPTDFHPRSGLGLYVAVGRASFRSVILEPLASGN